jgi:Uma2 family endonuclease
MATAAKFRRFTREEYEHLVREGFFHPGERVELIDGYLHEMSPQDSWHASGVQAFQEVLIPIFRKGYNVRFQMPLALGLDSEPEPDVAVVRGHWRDYRGSHPTTAVLVVEVADSTLLYDRDSKGRLYASVDILDYWILNRRDACLEVLRDPRQGKYQSRTILRDGDMVSPLAKPGISIPVSNFIV